MLVQKAQDYRYKYAKAAIYKEFYQRLDATEEWRKAMELDYLLRLNEDGEDVDDKLACKLDGLPQFVDPFTTTSTDCDLAIVITTQFQSDGNNCESFGVTLL